MNKIFLKSIIAILIIAILSYTYFILKKAGVFLEIKPNFDGTVEVIKSPPGIEDIEIDDETGLAYLSSLDRRNRRNNGAIFLFNTLDSSKKFIDISAKLNLKEFRPHGISFINSNGQKLLFVINHKNEHDEVLVFEIKDSDLNLLKIIKDSNFKSLNDLTAINENEFYVTNDHNQRPNFWRTLCDIVSIGTGNVIYYDGSKSKIIEDKIAYANGINLSKNHKTLFVTSTLDNALYVYDLKEGFKNPNKVYTQKLGISPDNIDIDNEDNIYIACHPKTLQFMSHAKDADKKSASAFLKLIYLPDTDYKFLQEGLFIDDGNKISGSSVAAQYSSNGKTAFLVGGVFEPKILKCLRK